MLKPLIILSFEEWEDEYKPIRNHIDNHASYEGLMFETCDAEFQYVRSQCKKNIVWSLQDSEIHDGVVICEGLHLANVIGYFITEIPYDPEYNYNIIDN